MIVQDREYGSAKAGSRSYFIEVMRFCNIQQASELMWGVKISTPCGMALPSGWPWSEQRRCRRRA